MEPRESFFQGIREKVANLEELGIFIDHRYIDRLPEEFFIDPINYLESHGKVMKDDRPDRSIESQFKVLELNGIVVKIVNPSKVEGDPLFELKILGLLEQLGLPSAKPIGHISKEKFTIVLYEKLEGHTTKDPDIKELYAKYGKKELQQKIQEKLDTLRESYEKVGIYREHWRPKDCVFNLDSEGNVTQVIPIDWEKTRIDWEKMKIALEENSAKDASI